MKTFTLAALVATIAGGCYSTKLKTKAPSDAARYERRQWFLLAGAIPLSRSAGSECPDGVATVESEMSGTDVLIQIGLTALGTILANNQCHTGQDYSYEGCLIGYSLLPDILGSRTVTYTCRATPTTKPAAPPSVMTRKPAPPSTPVPDALPPPTGAGIDDEMP